MKPYRIKHEDERSFTIHDGTSEFRVAKKGLSDSIHKKIRGFAEGGPVSNEASPANRGVRLKSLLESDEGGDMPNQNKQQVPTKQDKKPVKMAEGGDPKEVSYNVPQVPPLREPLSKEDLPETIPADATISFPQPAPVPQRAEQGVPPMLAPNAPQQPAAPPNSAYSPLFQPAGGGNDRYEREYSQGEKEAIAATQAQADVAKKMAKEQLGLQQARMVATQQAHQEALKHISDINNETQATDKWLKENPLNSQRWWQNKSTAGKVSSAIGLILGGIGSGLTRGPNAALDLLNREIDRDIEAQKANINEKNNHLAQLARRLGDVRMAESAERAYQTDLLASQIEQTGLKYADPKIQAETQAHVAALRQQSAQQKSAIATQYVDRALKGYDMQQKQMALEQQKYVLGAMQSGDYSNPLHPLHGYYVPGEGLAGSPQEAEKRKEQKEGEEAQKMLVGEAPKLSTPEAAWSKLPGTQLRQQVESWKTNMANEIMKSAGIQESQRNIVAPRILEELSAIASLNSSKRAGAIKDIKDRIQREELTRRQMLTPSSLR